MIAAYHVNERKFAMPRPTKADRPVHKKLALPQSIVAQVDLKLYSDLEQTVPYGAWSALVAQLLQEWLKKGSAQ